MSDIVVTVPRNFEYRGRRGLRAWLSEGDVPGTAWSGELWTYSTCDKKIPDVKSGERVYVVCQDALVGYAPLVDIAHERTSFGMYRLQIVRGGGAVAVSIKDRITGFRGWRYRWWDRGDEQPIDLSPWIQPPPPIKFGGDSACPRICSLCAGNHCWTEATLDEDDEWIDADDPNHVLHLDRNKAIREALGDHAAFWACRHCTAWVDGAFTSTGNEVPPDRAFALALLGLTPDDKLPRKTKPVAPLRAVAEQPLLF